MASIGLQVLGPHTETEDERLRELFWNRAALKKQLAGLRQEKLALKERLEQQENATRRAQKKLDQLEGRLVDPVKAANAILFYQLRGVWEQCQEVLARMSTDLLGHQQKREHKQVSSRFENSRRLSLESIDLHIAKVDRRVDELKQQLKVIHERHQQLRGFWNVLKRRRLRSQIGPLESALADVSAQAERYRQARKEKLEELGPDMAEIGQVGRRKINVALIAVAQELYLHFASRGVSGMAREATVRSVIDANYGDVDHCRSMSAHITERMQKLQVDQDLIDRVRNRTKFLEKLASYRDKRDVVPAASSLGQISILGADGFESDAHKAAPVNVLAEEYWELSRILLD